MLSEEDAAVEKFLQLKVTSDVREKEFNHHEESRLNHGIFSLLPRLVRGIHLAVIDHITSMPSILLPVKEMVSLCRSHGVEQVLVDGAHALGNVEHLDRLHHPVVSTTHGEGLAAERAWVGTRDYSAQLAVSAAEEFIQRENGGLETLRRFNHNSAVAMGNLLANERGTVRGAPAEMAAAMVMIYTTKKTIWSFRTLSSLLPENVPTCRFYNVPAMKSL
ncbi:hypothetical protein R1flu_025747 [Riccia fluitans]|uniref:Aminotransferase class V domain-containing protein n=1 Tax=Riccia fluitans TaxID=41844 RepID=A0ABD1XYM7_9MARC